MDQRKKMDYIPHDHAVVKDIGLFSIQVVPFSEWSEIIKVTDRKTTTAKQVLKIIFSRTGIPKPIVPEFCDDYYIHAKSIPGLVLYVNEMQPKKAVTQYLPAEFILFDNQYLLSKIYTSYQIQNVFTYSIVEVSFTLSLFLLLYSHEQQYIHLYMQKHIQHNNDERIQFFRKIYLSLYWKGYEGYYCVRGELETGQNCSILTPTLMAITAFLSRSPGLLNRGPGGLASARTLFSFQHLLSNCSKLPVAAVI